MFRFVGSAALWAVVVEAAEIEVKNGPRLRTECLFVFSSYWLSNETTVRTAVGANQRMCQQNGIAPWEQPGSRRYISSLPHDDPLISEGDSKDCFPQDFDVSGGCPNVTGECKLHMGLFTGADCSYHNMVQECNVTAESSVLAGGEDSCNGFLTTGTECAESLFHAGWDCFDDVLWAKNTGIHQHPEWYGSLTTSSSVEEFHSYISALPICSPEQPAPCAAHSCARPCYSYEVQEMDVCTVSIGDVGGMQNTCIPDGNGGSNFIDYRMTLEESRRWDGTYEQVCDDRESYGCVSHYPNPFCTGPTDARWCAMTDGQRRGSHCCNKDATMCGFECTGYAPGYPDKCHRLSPESECAGQMRWAMTEGIHQHPEWYPGLSVDSSFQDFQLFLSGLPRCSKNGNLPPCYGGSESCPVPCNWEGAFKFLDVVV